MAKDDDFTGIDWYERRGSGRLVKALTPKTIKPNWKYVSTRLLWFAPGWPPLPEDWMGDEDFGGIYTDGDETYVFGEVAYAWDGASSIMPDFSWVMAAAYQHDLLYQFHRVGLLPLTMRMGSDLVFKERMIRDSGVILRAKNAKARKGWLGAPARVRARAGHRIRVGIAKLAYLAVRKFGEKSALPGYTA